MSKNIVYNYRNINHIASMPGEYNSEEEFQEAVRAKYRKIAGKAEPGTVKVVVEKTPPVAKETPTGWQRLYTIEKSGVGWWNVMGPEGMKYNEKALREVDAVALMEQKNAEL